MSLEKYYGVLGLKPDASEQEVKNAYRDLAKVWHPDRFAHDPRLQQKAQDKLKEINEAYEEINSPASRRRRARRPTPPPPSSPPWSSSNSSTRPPRGPADFTTVVARRRAAPPRVSRLLPAAFAIAALVAIYFVSYRYLDSNTSAPAGANPRAAAAPSDEQRAGEVSDAGERSERKASGKQARAGQSAGAADGGEGATPAGARESAPTYKALPTVNLTIDPTTGLLATRSCPLKALRTFASGQEPQKYCDAEHTRKSVGVPPPTPAAPAPSQTAAQPAAQPATPSETKNKSRLKSVLGAVTSPGKWFRKKETPRGEMKTGAGQE